MQLDINKQIVTIRDLLAKSSRYIESSQEAMDELKKLNIAVITMQLEKEEVEYENIDLKAAIQAHVSRIHKLEKANEANDEIIAGYEGKIAHG